MCMTSAWTGAGRHPDIPAGLIHFVGRPRGPNGQLPPNVPVEPRDRMARIMHENALRAAPVFGTTGPALCFSEVSASAVRVLFATGVTGRGPYAPWALVFGKADLITAGARPVWYMNDEELQATAYLPAHLRLGRSPTHRHRAAHNPRCEPAQRSPGNGRNPTKRETRQAALSGHFFCSWF